MPTVRRRINFIPSPELDALIDEVSKYTGQTRARIVSEMLDKVAPVLVNTVHALRFVAEGRFEQAQEVIGEFASQGVADLKQAQLDLDREIRKTRRGLRKTTRELGPRKPRRGGASSE